VNRSIFGAVPSHVSPDAGQAHCADLVKSAYPFGSPSKAGSRKPEDGAPELDPSGWPKGDFGALLIASPAPVWPGVYVVRGRFEKQPTLSLMSSAGEVKNATFEASPSGTFQAEIHVPSPSSQLFVRCQGGGRCYDFQVWRPGYAPARNAKGPTWTREFVNSLLPFGILRTLGLARVNHLVGATLASVPRPEQATWNETGVPWSEIFELAKLADMDVWVTFPYAAPDELVHWIANEANHALPSDAFVWWEHGNETAWNWRFKQTGANHADAQQLVADGDPYGYNDPETNADVWRWLHHGRHTIRIARILQEVLGNDRERGILGLQYGDIFYASKLLAWMRAKYGELDQYLVATGIAPYSGSGDPAFLKRTDLARDDVLAYMTREAVNFPASDKWGRHFALAAQYRLGVAAYELAMGLGEGGDTRLRGPDGKVLKDPNGKDQDPTRYAKAAAMMEPQAGVAAGVYFEKLFSGHLAAGCHMTVVDSWSPNGWYALAPDARPEQLAAAPRYVAARDVARRYQGPRYPGPRPPVVKPLASSIVLEGMKSLVAELQERGL